MANGELKFYDPLFLDLEILVLSSDIITEPSNHHKTNQRLAPSGDFKETISNAPQKKVK